MKLKHLLKFHLLNRNCRINGSRLSTHVEALSLHKKAGDLSYILTPLTGKDLLINTTPPLRVGEGYSSKKGFYVRERRARLYTSLSFISIQVYVKTVAINSVDREPSWSNLINFCFSILFSLIPYHQICVNSVLAI